MQSRSRVCLSMVVAFAVFVLTVLPQPAEAQEHLVPLAELQGSMQSAASQRAQDMADIQRVLSYPAAVQALRKAHVNGDQMRAAVATLDGAELARLAQQARTAEPEVRAGFIKGILALIGLVVVIIIVVALVADAHPAPAAGNVAA